MAERTRRTSQGRQKIEIVKIENEANLLVTFSKRHKGLYKKAHELSSLTGAKVAIIGFSPKNKPFSFGCPSVPSILDKYQNSGPLPYNTLPDIFVQLGDIANLQKLNEEILSLEDKLREENRRAQTIDDRIRQREKYWWEAPTKELTLEQLEKFKMDLQNLRTHVSNGTTNSQIHHLLDCYVPVIDFGISQYAPALPSSIDGAIFAAGASSSTVAGCSSYQTTDLYPMEMESATGGVLQYAGPSRIDTSVQLIPGERSAPDIHDHPMASGSSNDPLLPYLFDYGYGPDESEFLKCCFD